MNELSGMLSGHLVVVTGASSGIGHAVMDTFAAAGAQCIGMARRAGGRIIRCDVTDESSVQTAFAEACREGPITDVVHSAGVASFDSVRDGSLREWERIIRTNLIGSFLVARESARLLTRGSTFTFVSSQGGLRADPLWSAYCASKFGQIGLMQAMARELAPAGIRVNAVCPGAVDTPMNDPVYERQSALSGKSVEELRRLEDEIIPLGAQATASQIADICLFLASDLSSHVAGAALLANGAM